MIGRRAGILGSLLAGVASAQDARRPEVVVLTPSQQQFDIDAFRDELRALGRVDGVSIALELWSADGDLSRLPALASDAAARRVAVIVAVNTPGSAAAIAATRSVPIVMVAVGDPVGLGFVASLARPGGNVTGISNLSVELSTKRLQLLHEAVPAAKRIAVVFNPDDPIHAGQRDAVEQAARALGIATEAVPIRLPDEAEPALTQAARRGAGAFIQLAGQAFTATPAIAAAALRLKLPAMLTNRRSMVIGGLLSYWSDDRDEPRRVAGYVDRILRGDPPGDLPVDLPTRFVFVVNMRTAAAIGATIPAGVLARADEVIE
ncbi:MAG: ABC transporter substrate-binding protein [Alphaproteobacteria bacterium]|nr:ABC transporter substrate-binding protein [Alphaproteobacteria bacterium]